MPTEGVIKAFSKAYTLIWSLPLPLSLEGFADISGVFLWELVSVRSVEKARLVSALQFIPKAFPTMYVKDLRLAFTGGRRSSPNPKKQLYTIIPPPPNRHVTCQTEKCDSSPHKMCCFALLYLMLGHWTWWCEACMMFLGHGNPFLKGPAAQFLCFHECPWTFRLFSCRISRALVTFRLHLLLQLLTLVISLL